jgi:hypothetical protein
MPSMPIYFVGKGRQFGFLDHQFGGDKADYMKAYDEALQRMGKPAPLADLADRHAGDWKGPHVSGLNADDAGHFRQHWLGTWWPNKDVEEVLRAGYRAAIERARDLELPIESLWVCANEDQFQVYISEGPRQVTVIVFTPPPGERDGGQREHTPEQLTEDEPIWVVKKKDDDDDEYTRRGGAPYEAVDATDDIILRRVRFA